MSFHFANQKGLLFFTGLTLIFSPLAQAQSGDAGQSILFSSPDGVETASNAILPVAHAPESQNLANAPAAPVSIFSQQQSGETLPPPAPATSRGNNVQNSADERKNWGLLTPAEIMDAPTPEKIFGLPEQNAAGDRQSLTPEERFAARQIQSADTNGFSSDESHWSKILYGDHGQSDANMFNPAIGGVENSPGILNRFFNAPGGSLFDSQNENANGSTIFAAPQPVQIPAQQTEMNRLQQLLQPSDSAATPASAANYSQKFSSPDSTFGSSMNSGSPFALPKNSSLETMPKLPTLPSISGQNDNLIQPVTPSWAPKPAPWLSPIPQLGTVPQRKF